MGFTLRSFLLPKGIRGITPRMNPPTVSPIGAPVGKRWAGPNRLRFLGFYPFESPWRPGKGLVCRSAGCSPGFCPSRVRHRKPGPDFRPNSSHTLRESDDCSSDPPASQSLDQPPTRLTRQRCRNIVAGRGDPHRVPAPCRSQTFKREVPGLCVHLASRRTLLSTVRCSVADLLALP